MSNSPILWVGESCQWLRLGGRMLYRSRKFDGVRAWWTWWEPTDAGQWRHLEAIPCYTGVVAEQAARAASVEIGKGAA